MTQLNASASQGIGRAEITTAESPAPATGSAAGRGPTSGSGTEVGLGTSLPAEQLVPDGVGTSPRGEHSFLPDDRPDRRRGRPAGGGVYGPRRDSLVQGLSTFHVAGRAEPGGGYLLRRRRVPGRPGGRRRAAGVVRPAPSESPPPGHGAGTVRPLPRRPRLRPGGPGPVELHRPRGLRRDRGDDPHPAGAFRQRRHAGVARVDPPRPLHAPGARLRGPGIAILRGQFPAPQRSVLQKSMGPPGATAAGASSTPGAAMVQPPRPADAPAMAGGTAGAGAFAQATVQTATDPGGAATPRPPLRRRARPAPRRRPSPSK